MSDTGSHRSRGSTNSRYRRKKSVQLKIDHHPEGTLLLSGDDQQRQHAQDTNEGKRKRKITTAATQALVLSALPSLKAGKSTTFRHHGSGVHIDQERLRHFSTVSHPLDRTQSLASHAAAPSPLTGHSLSTDSSTQLHLSAAPLFYATLPMARPSAYVPAESSSVYETRNTILDVIRKVKPDPVSRMSTSTGFSTTMPDSTHTEDDSRRKSVRIQNEVKSVIGPMSQKKALWNNYTDFDPNLVAGAAWKGWERKILQLKDMGESLDVWRSHFKEIEGRFGNATASYFRFLRWLVLLNLFTCLVVIPIIILPFQIPWEPNSWSSLPDNFSNRSWPSWMPTSHNLSDDAANSSDANNTNYFLQAVKCSKTYAGTVYNNTLSAETVQLVLDFFIGTGWMTNTSVFYGHYHNRTSYLDEEDEAKVSYDMGLAYFLCFGFTFLCSYLLILYNSSYSVKETVLDDQEHSSVHFTNSVLCGWDYCIFEERTAKAKKSILFQEFKADLLEQTKRLQRQNQTRRQKILLMGLRVLINLVVLGILGGVLYLIQFTTIKLLDLQTNQKEKILQVLIQLLPSLTITIFNAIIPEIFVGLAKFEDYWPAFELKITLVRSVLLRLSALGVHTLTLYLTVLSKKSEGMLCPEESKDSPVPLCCGNSRFRGNGTNDNVQCWETFVGQQFYKLAIVDFGAQVLIVFCIEFPIKFIYDNFKDRFTLVNKFGAQDFDVPKHVLDIVYAQTLSWLGMFFAPVLPAMTLLKFFFLFYIKKLSVMRNFAPPQHVYKVSRSNSFFNIILLVSFVLVAVLIGYLVGNIPPSKSCGPFRLYSSEKFVMWTAMTNMISHWPHWASTIIFFFGTTAFFVPCFILFCFMIYYFWAVGQGYKKMEEILQEQLRLEGKDKQFLLARVNDIIKHGNLQGVTTTISADKL